MVSIGLKALPLRKFTMGNYAEDNLMTEEDNHGHRAKEKGLNRKSNKKRNGFDGDHFSENLSGGAPDKTVKAPKVSKHQNVSKQQTLSIRKQVDPETAKYYSEIANVIEGTEVDFEERSIICGNALEESRGKEVELATDYVISHTLQSLLESCDLDHLCGFLQSCSKGFPLIATDRSGSHVAETALKSLAMHLLDDKSYSLAEKTLNMICQVIVENPVDMMCNCYGSHVLRSLLCLCKGAPLESSEFHATKPSTVLAERLNFKPSQQEENDSQNLQQGFPDLLKFLITGMLDTAKIDIAILQADQYSSLVLQTALKLLVGHEQELLYIIPILLGCKMEDGGGGNLIEISPALNLLSLMKETAYSRLMEVIVEAAPEALYDELFAKVFRNSLFDISSHQCANFVVQALISHARNQGHIELIWEELGPRFKDLLELGRSGVIASLVAASQRIHSHENKCCQALAASVCPEDEYPRSIVPHILFLDSYFSCKDKSNWSWPNGMKMHVMGSLILQLIFRFPSEYIQPFITSITSMEDSHVLEACKDSGGQRVIEAFLSSNVSAKQKRRLIVKLKGHFGDLAVHPSGSFTVDKCFNAGNISLREAIVSELLLVQTELSKTKQGPFLLRKLDVDGFAKRPDQWRLRQESKQSAYKDFYATFGSKGTKSSKTSNFLAETPQTSQPEKLKEMRKEIDARLTSAATPFLANEDSRTKMKKSGWKRSAGSSLGQLGETTPVDDDVTRSKNKKKGKKIHNGAENATAKPSHSPEKRDKKRHRKDDTTKSFTKKLKA